ncbi:zinc dependent phospholipase C family protein [Paenibacillus alkaliterrae]|uniref:zinc dependent phospholipase C family protein n=1 Tax=Paenibacillus alkaliterrae TaxID=320909 RepID=UPI001F3ED04F|nr:zinc dependent phospholipase C family protein [Paenibacillus alkaliterrae]MCF2939432.1 zinc dependent phospholipase C family protein [Paenibacillus alkaliterrae]
MPLPMVHISIAEKIFRHKGMEINADFLLGSIAPDAIHMREHTTREDKRRTHFGMNEESNVEDLFQIKLRLFFDSYHTDKQQYWFAKGYIAHVLTDLIWLHTVYRDFRTSIADNPMADERSVYYAETDQVDFNLFQNEPWRPEMWDILSNAVSVGVPGMLSAEEVEKWKARTLLWFTDSSKEPGVKPEYITEEKVQLFIRDTSNQLVSLFERNGYL